MASFSLSGLRKDTCNGHSVLAFSVDGVQVFCFIGWMQHTRKDLPGLQDLDLNLARAMCGFGVDHRYKDAQATRIKAADLFAAYRDTARTMAATTDKQAKRKQAADTFRHGYTLQLQGHSSFDYAASRYASANYETPSFYDTYDLREQALHLQKVARDSFLRVAMVRGLFD